MQPAWRISSPRVTEHVPLSALSARQSINLLHFKGPKYQNMGHLSIPCRNRNSGFGRDLTFGYLDPKSLGAGFPVQSFWYGAQGLHEKSFLSLATLYTRSIMSQRRKGYAPQKRNRNPRVEAMQLAHDVPPTPNRKRKDTQHKSSSINVETFGVNCSSVCGSFQKPRAPPHRTRSYHQGACKTVPQLTEAAMGWRV